MTSLQDSPAATLKNSEKFPKNPRFFRQSY